MIVYPITIIWLNADGMSNYGLGDMSIAYQAKP